MARYVQPLRPVIPMEGDERQLLARSRNGDRAAFGVVVRRYQVQVFNLVARVTCNRTLAEDVTQEAFLRAFGKLGQFDLNRRFLPWMYQIAVNLAKNALKAQGRQELPVGDSDDKVEAPSSQEKELFRKDLAARLERCLASLPEKYRTPLLLKHVEGMSYNEMEEVLGSPVWVLKMRVCRARARLRRMIESDPVIRELKGS